MPLMKNPADYWVIDTKTLSNRYTGIDFEMEDPSRNPEYAEMLKEEKARTLHLRNPHMPKSAASKASNLHEEYMLTDECHLYKTELDGYIFCDNEEHAKKILASLQSRDSDIKLSPLGKSFDTSKKVKK